VEPTDLDLLRSWQAGDRVAGTTLFRRYFPMIRRFFRNKIGASEVEDLVQRTFTGLVEGIGQFRGDASFRVFMFSVARHQLYKFLRDRGRREGRHDPDLGMSSIRALGHSPSSILQADEVQGFVQQALQEISVEHQLVIELFYWEGITGPEIAEVLGVAPATVRTRLFRARAELEEKLAPMLAGRKLDDLEQVVRDIGSRV
jgi:RNA polymerase sigma factor (sigma-70 family)